MRDLAELEESAESEPLRVLIADDHELVRRGLRMVLEAEPDIAVVGEAATSDEARDAALALRPDLLLLDLRMPGSAAPSVCADVLAASPETHVVVLSTFDDDSDVRAMMDAGASGYLLKDVQPDTLARSIRNIADGSVVMNPEIARRLMQSKGSDPSSLEDPLSPRELEVLQLMARGLKNREIAQAMWISESTVKTHVGRVIQKLGQRDRTQAVLDAIKRGIVAVDGV